MKAPGPKNLWPLGSIRDLQRDASHFFLEASYRFGDVVRFHVGPLVWHLLVHPEHVRSVLEDDGRRFSRTSVFQKRLRPLIGRGLVTSPEELWKRQRRLLEPIFCREGLEQMGPTIIQAAVDLRERWRGPAASAQPLDVVAELTQLMLSIDGRTVLGVDLRSEADPVRHALATAVEHIGYRFKHPLAPPEAVPTAQNRRFREAVRLLDSFLFELIEKRRRERNPGNDLLSVLVREQERQNGERMTERQLRDEVLTLLGAGYQPVSDSIAWTLYLLARNPKAEEELRREIQNELGTATPHIGDMTKLRYGWMVVQESLRLYPTVWVVPRKTTREEKFGPYCIPANTTIVLSSFVTHRQHAFWEAPETFDPERFLPERIAKRSPYAYFPFSLGAHACIGRELAVLQILSVLSIIVQSYSLQLLPGCEVRIEPLLTLKPRGIRMRAEARDPR